jgi:cytidine deaminase
VDPTSLTHGKLQRPMHNDWIGIVRSSLTALLATLIVHRICSIRQRNSLWQLQNGDEEYLRTCHIVRNELTKPRHSDFRVVAMLLLADGTQIIGANDEASPTISGSICAERCALLQHRVQYGRHNSSGTTSKMRQAKRIVAVYIVSDHPEMAVPPGCLCREYMYGHWAIDPLQTRIVLQSANSASSTPVVLSLVDLYPYPSLVVRSKNTLESLQRSLALQSRFREAWNQIDSHAATETSAALPNNVTWDNVRTLALVAQQQAAAPSPTLQALDSVYPIRYAAAAWIERQDAVMLSNGSNHHSSLEVSSMSIVTAVQYPAVEYGCTQDAVCRLLAKVLCIHPLPWRGVPWWNTATATAASLSPPRLVRQCQAKTTTIRWRQWSILKQWRRAYWHPWFQIYFDPILLTYGLQAKPGPNHDITCAEKLDTKSNQLALVESHG